MAVATRPARVPDDEGRRRAVRCTHTSQGPHAAAAECYVGLWVHINTVCPSSALQQFMCVHLLLAGSWQIRRGDPGKRSGRGRGSRLWHSGSAGQATGTAPEVRETWAEAQNPCYRTCFDRSDCTTSRQPAMAGVLRAPRHTVPMVQWHPSGSLNHR